MTVTAVVTVVAGRHEHLRRQQTMLGRCHRRPDLVVVVAMGDPEVERIVAEGPFGDTAVMAHVESERAGLPLARARNAGAQAALARGSKLVVFLDVDCLPSPLLLDRYHDAATLHHGRDLLCGPVAYLPPLAPGQNTYGPSVLADARPHPARPVPPPGVLQAADDLRLFWSLSFAVDRATWHHIGGFDEEYIGYGAEDTDFGQRAEEAGVTMWWVGGAVAHHQWHPVSDPPVEHLDDVVRNANLFHQRWGWYPMTGWLETFARRGLVVRENGSWVVVRRPEAV